MKITGELFENLELLHRTETGASAAFWEPVSSFPLPRAGGSRPLAAGEAPFDKSDDMHEVGDGIHHMVGAGAVEDVIRPRAAAREVFPSQRLGVGKRKTEAILADGDADRPGAPLGPSATPTVGRVGRGAFTLGLSQNRA